MKLIDYLYRCVKSGQVLTPDPDHRVVYVSRRGGKKRGRLRRRAASALVATAVLTWLPGTPSASAVTATFTPLADTYVSSQFPNTNFGTSTQYWIDGSPARRAYLRFNVTGTTGPVTSARLRIHVDNVSAAESVRGGTFRLMSSTSWAETSPTWNSQPSANGLTLGSLGAVARNTWVELNVTRAITGNGAYSIAITPDSSDGVAYDSRETGTLAPQLIIDTGNPPPPGDPVLVGAGDIASANTNDSTTAALLDTLPGTVFTTGDNVYPDGTLDQFNSFYGPTWGRHRARTRPAPGNHDYHTAGASGYYTYFGSQAGPSGRGYYSYDLGNWHVVSLNSEVSMVPGSAQETWLRTDLAASTKPCTLAYWHRPLFTSGNIHGPEPLTRPVFQALYDFDAEVVVAGHNHQYERFAPMNPSGGLDIANGIRSFVAGMGGTGHYGFNAPQPNSEVRNETAFGVLKFTLHEGSYDWQFVPVAGQTFNDSGTGTCR